MNVHLSVRGVELDVPIRSKRFEQIEGTGGTWLKVLQRATTIAGRSNLRDLLEDWIENVNIEMLPHESPPVEKLFDRIRPHIWMSERMLQPQRPGGLRPKPTFEDMEQAWKVVQEGGHEALLSWARVFIDGEEYNGVKFDQNWIPRLFWAPWKGGLTPESPLESAILRVNVRNLAMAFRKIRIG